MINLPKLILASGSPRRAEILTSVGWEFTKHTADIDETEFEGEDPADYVKRLAQEKAEKVAESYENALILGADTTVVIDGQIIGKPIDLEDAKRMLRMLSGRTHEVLTGVALARKDSDFHIQKNPNPKRELEIKPSAPTIGLVDFQSTKVKFAEMNEAEIEFLAENGEPLDKAGAYAVQAQAALFIEEIEGDYWNVVGLPINLVYRLLREINSV